MRLGKERVCYNLLRGEVGLTHYQVRTLAYRHMASQRWVRAIGKERAIFVEENAELIDSIAFQCLRDDPRVAGRAILSLVWNDRATPPAVCWTVVAEANLRVAKVMDYDKKQVRQMWETTRRLREWEANQGHKRWTEDHLETYLIIKGFIPPKTL